MKNQLFLLGCAVAMSVMPAIADEKKETPLGKQMETVDGAFKAFRKETDAVKGAAQAREAQQAVLKSVAEVPSRIQTMPEGPEKVMAHVEYRKMMGKLYVALCEVEEAFLNGKIDEVAKIVGSLKEMKKVGHEKFMDEEEEE